MPIRFRDDEFCNSSHQRRYQLRIRKAFAMASLPEPEPAGVAGFVPCVQPINTERTPRQYTAHLLAGSQRICRPSPAGVAATPVAGTAFVRLDAQAFEPAEAGQRDAYVPCPTASARPEIRVPMPAAGPVGLPLCTAVPTPLPVARGREMAREHAAALPATPRHELHEAGFEVALAGSKTGCRPGSSHAPLSLVPAAGELEGTRPLPRPVQLAGPVPPAMLAASLENGPHTRTGLGANSGFVRLRVAAQDRHPAALRMPALPETVGALALSPAWTGLPAPRMAGPAQALPELLSAPDAAGIPTAILPTAEPPVPESPHLPALPLELTADSDAGQPLFAPRAASFLRELSRPAARPGTPLTAEPVAAPIAVTQSVRLPRVAGGPLTALPTFLPVEIHCRRSQAPASRRPQWSFPPQPVQKPEFSVRPELPEIRRSKCVAPPPQVITPLPPRPHPKPKPRAKVFSLGSAQTRMAIAATVVLAGVFWFAGSYHRIADRSNGPSFTTTGVANPNARRSLREYVISRATVEMSPNFRSGIHCWLGAGNGWNRTWSYLQDGSVRVGQLAIYRPSIDLSNYRFEFLAQVDNKSVNWAFRAKDTRNYYAVKFNVVRPGPRPKVSVLRYPVLNGVKGESTEIPSPVTLHSGVPYRVTVSVRGNTFKTWVEDQEVDTWTDSTFTTGGVGFFSEGNERARLYWAKVSNNDDLLGRVCAFFAGKKPEVYYDDGQPIFCGGESKQRLMTYIYSPAEIDIPNRRRAT